jgi:hypothetical protein
MASETKTHWKKLQHPDYLGSYAFEPNKDIVLTIKSVKSDIVTGADGKKEECTIVYWREDQKPLILNRTNAKTITKLKESPYIEDWPGLRVQLYVARVKAFGEVVDAVRVRPYPPEEITDSASICTDCKKKIGPAYGKTAEYVAEHTFSTYGVALCADCAKARKGSS